MSQRLCWWSNVCKEKVVNYFVVWPLMRPLLWYTRMIGKDEQTSEYVADKIGSVIDEVNDAAGKPVVISVTTDNAPVMQKAWELLEQQRSIFCNGCSSHALNHILEEVLRLPWMELALSKSVTLSKFIRNRLQLLDKFRELQNDGKEGHRRALRLPVPTRWTFMKRFGKKPARLNEARGIVEDKEFWKRLKQVQKLLQPVVVVIAMLE
ncbi:hypothetical protein JG687_00003938 [Phytophthora cactorum]|uniref:DUF659 domain-containing protein n=2 Tax=Phytophthora cactorum TaxID=29920 RepID=A0A8T1USP2_9STRA|nr:hypothetical protein JG687_00003938 [Phytophthora cactorum]